MDWIYSYDVRWMLSSLYSFRNMRKADARPMVALVSVGISLGWIWMLVSVMSVLLQFCGRGILSSGVCIRGVLSKHID